MSSVVAGRIGNAHGAWACIDGTVLTSCVTEFARSNWLAVRIPPAEPAAPPTDDEQAGTSATTTTSPPPAMSAIGRVDVYSADPWVPSNTYPIEVRVAREPPPLDALNEPAAADDDGGHVPPRTSDSVQCGSPAHVPAGTSNAPYTAFWCADHSGEQQQQHAAHSATTPAAVGEWIIVREMPPPGAMPGRLFLSEISVHRLAPSPPPSPPSLPPAPPAAPGAPLPAAAESIHRAHVVDTLNARYRRGTPSNDLGRAGVLFHMFDGLGARGRPWEVQVQMRSCGLSQCHDPETPRLRTVPRSDTLPPLACMRVCALDFSQ